MGINHELSEYSKDSGDNPDNNHKVRKKQGGNLLTDSERIADRAERKRIKQEAQQYLRDYLKTVAELSTIRKEILFACARLAMKRHNFPEITIEVACLPSFDSDTMHYTLRISNLSTDYVFVESMAQALVTVVANNFEFSPEELPLYFSEDIIELHMFDEITDLPRLAQLPHLVNSGASQT